MPMPKNLRGKQLDRLIKEGEGPAGSETPAAAPAPARSMSQAEFSGYDKPRAQSTPPAEMLQRQFDRSPYNFDKSATDKKAGRYDR